MNSTLDVIVVGVGSMGSSACYYLAKQGSKVLGLEQFDIVHAFGSHSGQSRIIRKAYFEHSDYVPLLERAYQNWRSLEKEISQQLYFPTGLVYHGPRNHPVIEGVLKSAMLYNIPLQKSPGAKNSFFNIPSDFETVFEPDAGFLTPEKAIRAYATQAQHYGATIKTNERVLEWRRRGREIEVVTAKGLYRTRKLVFTSGAWTGKLLPTLTNQLKITRQVIAWIKPVNEADFMSGNFPCWMVADNEMPGVFYGFPFLDKKLFGEPTGMKLAYHYPSEQTDADEVDRRVNERDTRDLSDFLAKYSPALRAEFVASSICLYANSPDENFMVGVLPDANGDVMVACGFSGHGFKFVSVIGEILAELCNSGQSHLPIRFLAPDRFKTSTSAN